ncbi:alanine--tRNA ligase [Candidatus Saccharibacteria bacterium SW_7_54_9]|nr:MAG: alanine--tRNA ligase [Candidatus Saccharibacteria bacterium SW_7_54_9]
MQVDEIRQAYLDFFQNREHAVIPRANLVPHEDPTTLFTGSGMQPLLPYLLGQPHPKGDRLVNRQPCFRAEDVEEVGDNRHTTFFEMLGNWSLGDYFKSWQLEWFFTFLTKQVGLDPGRLSVTVFAGDEDLGIPRDEESAEVWHSLFASVDITAETAYVGSDDDGGDRGIHTGERIFYYDGSKNWWSRVGEPAEMPEGEPGGPDSEVFFDFGTEHDPEYGTYCHPNCDCGRFLEIGNSVFMQYVKRAGGFGELPQKNVDFGGGLERIAAAAADNPDVFKIDLMRPVIDALQSISGSRYEDEAESFRVIADHLRSAVFMATDGVTPSNSEQGYVLRRLVRRAVRHGLRIGIDQGVIERLAPVAMEVYQDSYPEIAQRQPEVIQLLQKEEAVFRQTIRKGMKEFDKLVGKDEPSANNTLTGEIIFKLYDTYGFPVELSFEEARKRDITIAEDWQHVFEQEMQKQRDRSRTAAKGQFKGGLGGEGDIHRKYHTATHLMYRALREVLGDHVLQHGSNITDERLRFDFSHPDKLADEEKHRIEQLVNERIEKDLKVTHQELPTEEAFDRGAYGAFGDTYGDRVTVYSMDDENGENYSFEICGGPHVERTSYLGEDGRRFKIKKEESSSAGIRRIKAVLE